MKNIARTIAAAALVAAAVCTGAPARAQDWEMPAGWDEVGRVEQWRGLDSLFYRVFENVQFLDTSQFKVDQVREYEKTKEDGGKVEGVTLDTWETLDDAEKTSRRKEARGDLKLVVDFRQRIEQQAQRTRQNLESGWGTQVADVTAVGDCLNRLNTAVWLDPSNPFTWHLLAYFTRIVGDLDRSEAALANARAALDRVPAGQLDDVRAGVALDQAWLYRDKGDFDRALEALDRAEALGVQGFEPTLVRGLIAAQTGDVQAAGEYARQLKSVEIRNFPPNLKSTSFGPELPNIASWRLKPSNYASAWILALSWLGEGNVDMARAAFREYSLNDLYPLAYRFWNDAGYIYEVTDRRQMANNAWKLARIHSPYIPYMVYKPYTANVGGLTGRGGPLPYILGFDRFFHSGSRLAFAVGLVDRLVNTDDDLKKQELAARALEQIEICQATGHYPGQAAVLAGQVYYLMGDLNSALIEVKGGLARMDELNDAPGAQAVLKGLSQARSELNPQDVANFFSQSGASGGRWTVSADPVAELAALRKAYADDASDANRRALARFLIREGDHAEGRTLALGPFPASALESKEIVKIPAEDIELVLEADRAEGSPDLALALVRALQGGAKDPWNTAGLWAMAGFACIDAGHDAEGKVALERASELDPGNQGLKVQLALMGGS